MRTKELTHQIVVRVDPALYRALQSDAERNGRTVAQSVRFVLNRHVERAVPGDESDRFPLGE